MVKSDDIKPISYLKANASKIIRNVVENHKTMIITQNGEAKVVLQDIKEYEKNLESLAMLKLLALSAKDIKSGDVMPIDQAFQEVRERVKKGRK